MSEKQVDVTKLCDQPHWANRMGCIRAEDLTRVFGGLGSRNGGDKSPLNGIMKHALSDKNQ